MVIYKLEMCENYSYEVNYELHFETFEKAKKYAMEKGFYRVGREGESTLMETPLAGKVFLEVGNFLLDINKTFLVSEKYDDESLWSLDADYAYIREIKAL